MELFGTLTSPYTRIVRMVALEFGFDLCFREMVWRQTPAALFELNPAGRIPLLIDGEISIADSRTICAYLMAHPAARSTDSFRRLSDGTRWAEENLTGLVYAAMDSLMIIRGLGDPPAVSHPYLDRCRDRVDHCLAALNAAAAGRFLVTPDGFGLVETALIAATDVIAGRGVADLAPYRNIDAIRARFADRPSVRTTMPRF